ncbi:MAG: hypothetical protein EDX89_11865 [Acidobacteria bacterium]|nr:MAG: hypothetical protein EDX89_11865 [Acidobacteriota bacterium]
MSLDPVAVRRFVESLSTHLEDHLAAWKSSLADARRDVESTLTAAAEKIPAQGKSLFPEDIMKMLLEDVLPPPAPPERVVEVVEKVVEKRVEIPTAAPTLDWGLVRTSLAAIESARTQVDILTRYLHEAQAHASRVALLVLRNDRLTGWKALGYDVTGGRDDASKGVDLAAADDPFAAEVLKRERTMEAAPPSEASPLRRALGGNAPARSVLVPMVIRDRLAGLLMADEMPGDDGRLNASALEVLTFATGFAVDLLAARKKIPSPTLTPTGDSIPLFVPPAAAPSPAATVHVPALDFEPPAPAPAPAPPPRPAAAPPSVDQSDAARARRKITDAGEALRALEESAAAKRKSDLSGAIDFGTPSGRIQRLEPTRPATPPPSAASLAVPPIPVAAPAPAPPPVAAPPPGPPPSSPGDLTRAFDQIKGGPAAPAPPVAPAVAPPPPPSPPPSVESSAPRPVPAPAPVGEAIAASGATPLAAPAGFVPRSRAARADDPKRAVEDAKRLARLLVSEIKLYNEKKVEEGRAAGDIYSRLKDDIERSRQVYVERTPESVRAEGDFFHDELVRILADGRADALGPVN